MCAGGRLEGEVECDFAVIEGLLDAPLVSKEVATVGPSARVNGDVIYNVLELDRVGATPHLGADTRHEQMWPPPPPFVLSVLTLSRVFEENGATS